MLAVHVDGPAGPVRLDAVLEAFTESISACLPAERTAWLVGWLVLRPASPYFVFFCCICPCFDLSLLLATASRRFALLDWINVSGCEGRFRRCLFLLLGIPCVPCLFLHCLLSCLRRPVDLSVAEWLGLLSCFAFRVLRLDRDAFGGLHAVRRHARRTSALFVAQV